MKSKILIAVGAAAVIVAAGLALRRSGFGSVRNEAAGPRLPGMPSMPAMPNMPTMPTMPTMGNAPNAPQLSAATGLPTASLFRGMWG